jgi:hypothetical protein
MADRIFPNRVQEGELDSELVYQGINWEGLNIVEAKKKSPKMSKELVEHFKNHVSAENEDDAVIAALKALAEDSDDDDEDDDDDDDDDDGAVVEEEVEETEDDDTEEDDDDGEEEAMNETKHEKVVRGKDVKANRQIHFNHPSQLSAEAVEAAIASGDKPLVNAILAARHERRVRLANKIEKIVEAQNATKKNVKVASQETNFVKVSEANSAAKNAFIKKAQSAGFPQEYIDAMLGTSAHTENNDVVEIKNVMASELTNNIKKSAVTGLVKVATLTNADYDRLKRYWKEELGYGDQEWIDELFTKKYD